MNQWTTFCVQLSLLAFCKPQIRGERLFAISGEGSVMAQLQVLQRTLAAFLCQKCVFMLELYALSFFERMLVREDLEFYRRSSIISACGQEVGRFCRWFGDDFAEDVGGVCLQRCVGVCMLELFALPIVL